MNTRGALLPNLVKQSENLLPAEFYDVRQETAPKAGWLPMYTFAAFAYAGAIIAFAVIFNSESHKTTTETLIGPADITGHDGYSCQMISKVTASYEIASPSGYDPSQAFQLINVIESKAGYEADYAIADPCSQPLVYFPGSTIDLFPGRIVRYGATTFYGPDMAYIFAVGDDTIHVIFMNYTSGDISGVETPSDMLPSSLATDADGFPIMLSNDGSSLYGVYRVNMGTLEVESLYNVTLDAAPIVMNDNLYNIYVAENTTFIALDVYNTDTTGAATNTTLFNTRVGESIAYAAVYNSGSSIKVYYVNNTGHDTTWEDGVFTSGSHRYHCVGVAVDGDDRVYFLHFTPEEEGEGTVYVGDAVGYARTEFSSNSAPPGFSVTQYGSRTVVIKTEPSGVSDSIVFATNISQPGVHISEIVQIQYDFSAGYFTCGNSTLDSRQFDVVTSDEYSTVCRDNGVVAQVLFKQSRIFTQFDAATYAINHATSRCAALTTPIGETIADLPPYSCSRSIHPSFLACFATAAANTQLLFQVLVFLSALALSKLAMRYPPQTPLRVTTPITPCAVEMAAVGKGLHHDIENPMVQ